MKQRILFALSIVAAALLAGNCVGDVIEVISDSEGGSSTTLVDPELKWSASSCEATLGASNSFPSLTNSYGVAVTFSSSDTEVATIAGNGSLTLVAAGTATITASSAETSAYAASSASYTLTVVKAASGLAWSAESCTATIGADNSFPTLSNPGNQTITYASSNESVATIATDGTITLVAAGTATITASAAESAQYEAGSVSYALTVNKATVTLSWSAETCQAILGESNTFPTLNNPAKLSVTYTSSNTAVATIATDGTVTLIGEGSATITAASEATETHEACSAFYTLTVVTKESTLKSADLSWSAASYNASMGGGNSFPTLNNPHGLSVTYVSSNSDVAAIAADGVITLKGAGSATITASSAATDEYAAGTAAYTLTVSRVAAGLSWSETSYTATLASSENSYPTLNNANGLSVSYSSSNTDVATVDADGKITLVGAGTTAIYATSEASDVYEAGSAYYTLKVVKHELSLSWSAATFTASLEDSNTFPTLAIDPSDAGISISYASSNTSVATVNASTGAITLKAAGSTTISATFEGDSNYKAASDSYVLNVTSSADDGAVTTTFPSAGDSASDDDISNTSFTRLITVTYSSGGASVSGYSAVSDVFKVTTSGNQVTITYSGSENVAYKLTGTASDGFFKLYSPKKQAIWLSGLSLTNTAGAAINNQSGKRTFVYVEGTNSLADGSSAAYSTSSDEDMKGVFFSEGQLVFSGSGSLTVTANNAQSKSGIVSDDYVRMMASPSVTVTAGSSAGHGLRGKEYVQLSDGTLSITTKAAMKKGIGSDDYVLVEGGTTAISVSGGVAYDSDDSEYKGSAGIKADNYFAMTGGNVTITNSGKGGKGISAGSYDYDATSHTLSDSYISGGTLKITTTGSESNDVSCKGIKIGWVTKSGNRVTGYAGNLKISGGSIVVSAAKSEGVEAKGNLTISGGELYSYSTGDDAINCQGEMNITGGYVYAFSSANDAMDANHDFKISGGYVFAVTTAGNPEVALDANTEDSYKLYINSGATVVAYGGIESGASLSQTCYTMSCTAGNWNALHNGSSYIAAFKAPSGCSSVVVSAPSLSKGYKGVSVGSATYCNGIWATSGISGGSSVSLSTYSGGNSGPGGNNGPGGRP
ncbi:MAG: carbohydrate-binding domain-containing protein [Bacteroidales bacterium]|nr:carbohydrate-binding domain-containing protein [Bacteroidales bacterium]